MSIISRILDSAKKMRDTILPVAAKPLINHYLEDYGEMLNFKIDSENKKFFIEVLLKGEDSSIWLELEDYELVKEEEGSYLTFKNAKASREWMDVAINTMAEKLNHKIEIPDDAAKLLGLIL